MAAFSETDIQDYLQQGYLISTDKTLLDMGQVHDFLANQSYWSKGLTNERFNISVTNSLCFGIYKNTETVGFARVVTDKAIFAYICDVFIVDRHQGKGLGKWLIHTITTHPELQGLKRWSLATKDAHDLYKQFGFSLLTKPENWMEIYTPFDI